MKWMVDPKNGKQSVTLTLMIISFILLVAGVIAMIFGKIDSIGPLLELYVTNTVLYYGRRAKLKTKNLSVEQEGTSNE